MRMENYTLILVTQIYGTSPAGPGTNPELLGTISVKHRARR